MKKNRLCVYIHIYAHIVSWENVCYCWIFSLLRQSVQFNCEGGYCYTNGCVSTYSHKCHGFNKPKISLADKTVTWILLFILSGKEIRDCGQWSMLMTTTSAGKLLWRANSSGALYLQGAQWKREMGPRLSLLLLQVQWLVKISHLLPKVKLSFPHCCTGMAWD